METYLNSAAPAEERARDLLARMGLDEKIGQMVQADGRTDADSWILDRHVGSFLHVTGDEAIRLQRVAERTRLRVPLLFGIDAIHGHGFGRDTVVYPTQLALASSFDPGLARRVARRTAREVAAAGLHMTFSPVLCLGRDPRWGRVDETFGEDPFLAGELGAAMVEGYQGDSLAEPGSILACAKHFAAYGETIGGRDSTEAEVSRRKLESVFLPPFDRAVKAGCASFMAGYNAIDGTPCSANAWLLRERLKGRAGFEGFVVTDWNNVGALVALQKVAEDLRAASVLAAVAGNDLIMNTPGFYAAALEAARSGDIPPEVVDEACLRILRKKFELGLFDAKRYPAIEISAADRAEDRILAKEAALASMVLLENPGEVLPFGRSVRKLAVVGPNADVVFNLLGDWSFGPRDPGVVAWNGNHADAVTPLRGLHAFLEARGGEVVHERGCGIMDGEDGIARAVSAAAGADAVVCVLGDDFNQNGEGRDRADLDLTGRQRELAEALAAVGKPLAVVLVNGKPLTVPWLKGLPCAVVEAWNAGAEAGSALAELLFGEADFTGRLAISWPRTTGQIPAHYMELPGWHAASYHDVEPGPLYPFGYGLSYAEFAYGEPRTDRAVYPAAGAAEIEVRVEAANVGARAGVANVQVYVRDLVSSVTTPDKRLVGWARVRLEAGERKDAVVRVPVDRLALVDADCRRVVEPGAFDILAGPSSADLKAARIRAE